MAARSGGSLWILLLVTAAVVTAVSLYSLRGTDMSVGNGDWQLSSTSIFSGRATVTSLQTGNLLSGQRFRFVCAGNELAMSADFGYLRGGHLNEGVALTTVVPSQRWTSHWVYIDGKFYNSDPDEVVRLLSGLTAGRGFRLEGVKGQRISLSESPPEKDIRHLAHACGYRMTAANAVAPRQAGWKHPLTQVVDALKSLR